MEATELVLQTMHKAGMPLRADKIAKLSGLDRKVVDKAMKELIGVQNWLVQKLTGAGTTTA